MRITRLLIAIAATLALLMLPTAAQAGDRSKPHAHAQRSAGVVRSFRGGVLAIRLVGGGVKTAAVTDSTELSCQANRSKRSRKRAKRRRGGAQGRRARAAEAGGGEDPGADDGAGDDTGDDPGDDQNGDTGDDTTDDTGGDTGDGTDQQDPASNPHPAKRTCSTATLRRGMRVKVATLGSGPDGPVWTRIALLRRRR